MLTESTSSPGYLVAIKTLHAAMSADRAALLQEAAVMAQLSSSRIVGLVGVVTVGAPLMVILEYCEHGALNEYLVSHDTELQLTDKLALACDCAEGMSYLASRNFVHRHLAARNVLVSSDRRAKISDFGMSRDTSTSEFYKSRGGQVCISSISSMCHLNCINYNDTSTSASPSQSVSAILCVCLSVSLSLSFIH
jgi:serine/threonine protein kinase